jgi:hypothetical protein
MTFTFENQSHKMITLEVATGSLAVTLAFIGAGIRSAHKNNNPLKILKLMFLSYLTITLYSIAMWVVAVMYLFSFLSSKLRGFVLGVSTFVLSVLMMIIISALVPALTIAFLVAIRL